MLGEGGVLQGFGWSLTGDLYLPVLFVYWLVSMGWTVHGALPDKPFAIVHMD